MTIQTHIIIRDLQAKGFDASQAAAVVEAFTQLQNESAATKADLMTMKTEIRDDISGVKNEMALFRNDFEWFQRMALRLGIGGVAVFATGVGVIGYLLQQLIIK